MARKPLDYDQLNENVKKVQYAVRGELYLRASELQKEGKEIVFTNVGNPHALGQKPLTFPRQVPIANPSWIGQWNWLFTSPLL
jgi:glutamate--glyoxylate aminotransferase